MIDSDQAERTAVLARMALSRAEIVQILDPPPDAPGEEGSAPNFGFPRSRTMRALMSKGGLGTVGALAGGLLLARPTLAFKLLRLLPTGAVGKVILAKAIGAFASKQKR
jgi:hypothetical protein